MLRLSTGKAEWARVYNSQQHEIVREGNDYWRKVFTDEGLLDESGEPVRNALADITLESGSGAKAPALAIRVKLKKRGGDYVLPILRLERVR